MEWQRTETAAKAAFATEQAEVSSALRVEYEAQEAALRREVAAEAAAAVLSSEGASAVSDDDGDTLQDMLKRSSPSFSEVDERPRLARCC